MDDLLREFLTETNESLDVVNVELVRFEQEPNNAKLLDNIFRLVHTIKGTCGFLGLPRLEALAHAAEGLMGKFRDGLPVTADAVTLVLSTLDRIKDILNELDRCAREPDGNDDDLIAALDAMAVRNAAAADRLSERSVGTLVPQVLERALRGNEVSLDDLERAFREAPGPDAASAAAAVPLRQGAKVAAEPAEREERTDAKSASQSIRVNVETLESLMTMVSELVLTRNQLLEIVRRHEDSEFKGPLQRLSNVTAELQESVMKTRMQPIGSAWQKLPRIVRDLCSELGKDIELEMLGAETELDRQVLDLIKDPLTHMVRNSADHGIETPAERRAAGKPEQGTIRLAAHHEGGHIIVSISDDGRGLDIERIKLRALVSGLANEVELAKMADNQIHKFIFAPGFSTAAEVTAVSGRGVGLDVVRANIDQIGGTVEVRAVPGRGTSFTVKIPLTLAIISALIVSVGGNRFAIPQLAVVEVVRVKVHSEHRIERIKDALVLRLREKLLPLVQLSRLLGIERDGADPQSGLIVVTQIGSQTFGIIVDAVLHTDEIVVKPMSSRLRHINLFSGNTILGDGAVIMIIDPNGVAQSIAPTVTGHPVVRGESDADEAAPEEEVSLLVFRAGTPEQKAVPLSLVTRLEEIDGRTIEMADGRHMVQYRGQLMPLIRVNEDVRVNTDGAQPLLVFTDNGRSMGLVVDEIVDIVQDRLDIQVASHKAGILGSTIVKGHATDIIDVGHFLPMAYEDWFRRKEMRAQGIGGRLLLVDDSEFFRNMLAPVLKAAGYDVTAVGSAAAALELLQAGRRFDVLVTDVEMPDMNGFELAQAVRQDRRGFNLPVIALSAMATPEAIARGREVGFDDYVAKFDRKGLIAALKEQTLDLRAA